MFQQLNASEGITIILVTHDADVAGYAHRIIRIRDGLIEARRPAIRAAPRRSGPADRDGMRIAEHRRRQHADSAHVAQAAPRLAASATPAVEGRAALGDVDCDTSRSRAVPASSLPHAAHGPARPAAATSCARP